MNASEYETTGGKPEDIIEKGGHAAEKEIADIKLPELPTGPGPGSAPSGNPGEAPAGDSTS
jgi:hypothetical protein